MCVYIDRCIYFLPPGLCIALKDLKFSILMKFHLSFFSLGQCLLHPLLGNVPSPRLQCFLPCVLLDAPHLFCIEIDQIKRHECTNESS